MMRRARLRLLLDDRAERFVELRIVDRQHRRVRAAAR